MRISLQPGLVRRTAVTVTLIASSLLAGLSSLGVPAASALTNLERHYEMVSPVYKGGYGATKIAAVAANEENPNGESVAYSSVGVFAGATESSLFTFEPAYFAHRGPSGWETAPLRAPASLFNDVGVDLSPDLETEFGVGSMAPSAYSNLVDREGLWLHPTGSPDTDAGWQHVGQVEIPGDELAVHSELVGYDTANPDFCHVLFYTSLEDQGLLVPEAMGAYVPLFEYDRGCDGGSASVRLVGVNNQNKIIDRECLVEPGGVSAGPPGGALSYIAHDPSSTHAISTNGSQVFFTTCLSGHGFDAGDPHQLFVRVGGSRTLEVSRPLEGGAFGGCVGEDGVAGEVPCAGAVTRPSADFSGASENGSTVYFTTTAQLTATDKDTGKDLYMATIGCPSAGSECQASEREVRSLTQVSQDPNGGAAEVQGVLRVAPDGQRAYFVARGELLTGPQRHALESEGRPVPRSGADNLYVYDDAAGGNISFVGDLCSGLNRSGAAEDAGCPSGGSDESLWQPEGYQSGGESQTARPSGEFLVFSTYAQLVSEDTNSAKDVYRYDAQSGVVSLVSVGEDAYEPSGSADLSAGIAEGHRGGPLSDEYELNDRAISGDGSRIVFTSARPLSPAVTNGLVNAYEWHAGPDGQGSVSLISSGNAVEAVTDVVISPSGSSVFFVTSQGLVPQDTDGLDDVYDARLGEGFPAAPSERQPCEGDGCQGPLTNPAPLLVPGSVSQAPGEDFPPPPTTVAPKPEPKPKLCKKGFVKKKNKCIKKAKAKKASRDRRMKS